MERMSNRKNDEWRDSVLEDALALNTHWTRSAGGSPLYTSF